MLLVLRNLHFICHSPPSFLGCGWGVGLFSEYDHLLVVGVKLLCFCCGVGLSLTAKGMSNDGGDCYACFFLFVVFLWNRSGFLVFHVLVVDWEMVDGSLRELATSTVVMTIQTCYAVLRAGQPAGIEDCGVTDVFGGSLNESRSAAEGAFAERYLYYPAGVLCFVNWFSVTSWLRHLLPAVWFFSL